METDLSEGVDGHDAKDAGDRYAEEEINWQWDREGIEGVPERTEHVSLPALGSSTESVVFSRSFGFE